MKILQYFISLGVILLLCSCGELPTKESNTVAGSSADIEDYFIEGQKHWDAWEKNNSTEELHNAQAWYRKAYTASPDEASYQHAYYLSSVYLGFYTENISETELLSLFNKLNPIVKAEVPPPARMLYAIGNFKNEPANTLIPIVQRAIQQKPDDAMSWRQLSQQYLRLDQHQLAANAAHKAMTIDSNSAEYAWQFGSSLEKVASDFRCDQTEELKQAAFFTAKAAAMQNDSPDWYADSAQRYVDLGLLPLAQHQLHIAHALKPTANYISAFVHASIIEGLDFQTNEFIKDAEQAEHTQESFIALAMAAAVNGEWHNAREFMALAKKRKEFDFYDLLIYVWISEIAQNSSIANAQLRLKTNLNTTEKTIKDFILAGNNNPQELTNKLKPNNACSKQQVDFYIAMKEWKVGNTSQMKSNLRKAAESPHFFSREKVWATALLQGMEFTGSKEN